MFFDMVQRIFKQKQVVGEGCSSGKGSGEHTSLWALCVPFLLLGFVPKHQNPTKGVTSDSQVNFAGSIN